MICKQEACRDARSVRPLRWECKSVYIGSCVRSILNVSPYASARVSVQGILKANSVVVETNTRSVLSGRTGRASLHASCLQIIFIIRLILKVKVLCSKVRVKVPTCIRITRHVSHIDNQRLTPYVSISAILHGNLTYFTVQYDPYYRAMWLILQRHSCYYAFQYPPRYSLSPPLEGSGGGSSHSSYTTPTVAKMG